LLEGLAIQPFKSLLTARDTSHDGLQVLGDHERIQAVQAVQPKGIQTEFELLEQPEADHLLLGLQVVPSALLVHVVRGLGVSGAQDLARQPSNEVDAGLLGRAGYGRVDRDRDTPRLVHGLPLEHLSHN